MLFPNVFLPLHIFEPRYRQMVSEALAGDRMIGMVLLQPGYEEDYDGRPPIYRTGCSGLITHAERLDDGGSTWCCAASRSSRSHARRNRRPAVSTQRRDHADRRIRARRSATELPSAAQALEKLLAPLMTKRPRTQPAAGDAGRRSHQRAGAVSRVRADRKAGAARTARAAGALPVDGGICWK